MKTVRIGNVELGEGMPKICVPIMAKDGDEAERQAAAAEDLPCSLLEFRADYLAGRRWNDRNELEKISGRIKAVSSKPVILTIRTADEGGCADIGRTAYYSHIRDIVETVPADAIDIEPFDADSDFNEDRIRFLADNAHENGKKVIFSSHDFKSTPAVDVMVRRLWIMQEMGADIPKIAVMPKTEDDVIDLLTAACVMRDEYAKGPFIALSMGELGRESRICGGEFGSAVTFASGGESLGMSKSAPGQMDAVTLNEYLIEYYKEEIDKDGDE